MKLKLHVEKFKYDTGYIHFLETEAQMRQDQSWTADGTPINLGLEIIQPIDLNDPVKFVYDKRHTISSLSPEK